MLHIVADGVTKFVEKHLADNEDQDTEADVAQGPAVVQGIHN
jgi:hypothetical protein